MSFPTVLICQFFDKCIIFVWFTQGVYENSVKISNGGKAKNKSLAVIFLWIFETFSARVT